MKRHKKIGMIICFAFIMIILWCAFLYREQVQAIFNEDTAIHIDASSIENATLIIGTHLIYLGSLNDSIYEIAMTSAQDSGQQHIYYKSELADGAWFDITDAGSLEDIMGDGMRVENELINGLFMTHHTKADGITYDLRKNETVSIFQIYDTYELEEMAELQPLKLRYDKLKVENMDADKKKYYLKVIGNFFRTTLSEEEEKQLEIKQSDITRVHTNGTKLYDEQMQAMQNYYEILKNNGASTSETDTVLKVMSKLDSTKRTAVYKIIEEALEKLSDKVEEKPDVDEALLTAIMESRLNISDELTVLLEKSFSVGTTVMTNLEYDLEQNFITAAQQERHSDCDLIVTKMNSLYHIMDGQIVTKQLELETASELIDRMGSKFEESLGIGVDEEYEKAIATHSSHVILENIIKSHNVTWNVLRSELQFYIQAKIDRLEKEEALAFIKERIGSTGKLRTVIPLDAFQASAKDTVETHVTWLQNLYASLSGEEGESELDKLLEEKVKLQEEKMAALDKEDIREAKKIDAKILEKANQISKIEEAVTNELVVLEANRTALEVQLADQADDSPMKTTLINRLTDLQQQIAETGSKLSDESTAQNIQDMKRDALTLIKAGEVSGNKLEELSGYIEGIGTFLEWGSALALDAQKNIYNAMLTAVYLKEQTAYDPLIARIEEQIENNMEDHQDSALTASTALRAMEDALGGSLTVKKESKISNDILSGGLPAVGSSNGDTDGSIGSAGGTGSGEGKPVGGSEGSVGTGSAEGTPVGGSEGTVGTGSGEGKPIGGSEGTVGTGSGEGTTVGGSDSTVETGSGDGTTVGGSDSTVETGSVEAKPIGGSEGTVGTGTVGGTTGSGSAGGSETVGGTTGSKTTDGTEIEGGDVTVKVDSIEKESILAAMVALSDYAEQTENEEIMSIAAGLAVSMMKDKNSNVFEKISSVNGNFAPASALADYLHYRYLWNDSKKTAVVANGLTYYRFTAFYNTVERNNEQSDSMSVAAEFKKTVYIPSDYLYQEFGCRVINIAGTKYAILADDDVIKESKDLMNVLQEKEGGK